MRTIGMIEMHVRHSAKAISDLIIQKLQSYGVSMLQIHGFTADNASNMNLTAELLDEIANRENDRSQCQIENDDLLSKQIAEIGKQLSQLLQSAFTTLNLQSITGCGCANHSLQIAINDGLCVSDAALLITECREKVKKLRNQVYLLEFRDSKYPILDVDTRWCSTYLMVRR